MVSSQKYINQNYLDKKIKTLDIEGQDLEGFLNLSEFTDLEELNCSHNEITNLDLSKCLNLKKVDFSYNLFDNLDFLVGLPHPEKLVSLNLDECGVFLDEKDIAQILLPFVNLEKSAETKLNELKIQLQEISNIVLSTTVLDFATLKEEIERLKIQDLLFTGKTTKDQNNYKIYIMTNKRNNNNKIIFIEWKERGLKDGTMPYEKFKVIIGSEKEELIFYSTFFDDDIRFKKGEIYELSMTGNFVEDSSKIIQGVDKDGYEFEKVTPPLLIKELWEEKEKSNESLSLLEENLEKKKEDVNKINQDLFNANKEIADLKQQLENLRLEKRGISEKLNISEENFQREKGKFDEKNREWNDVVIEAKEFKKQVDDLQKQKTKVENDWASPEKHKKVVQEVEDLSKQLKTERRNNQKLTNLLEDIRNQELEETIQTKLKAKKEELNQLIVNTRLAGEQKLLLEGLLEKQESLDLLVFDDDVKQTSKTFTRAQDKLQEAKDKLVAKLSAEEVEVLCQTQAEISKLENSQRQCEKFEAFVGAPDK